MEELIVLQQLHSWFKIAPRIWIALLAGWLWVIVSWLINFEPAASGAMLVGFAIIAEHFFLRWPYRKIDMDADDGSTASREVEKYQNKDMRILAKEKDKVDGELAAWKTAKRVERKLEFAIVISMFAGTIIWGYGHLLVSSNRYALCTCA